jgi:hypothetical protein
MPRRAVGALSRDDCGNDALIMFEPPSAEEATRSKGTRKSERATADPSHSKKSKKIWAANVPTPAAVHSAIGRVTDHCDGHHSFAPPAFLCSNQAGARRVWVNMSDEDFKSLRPRIEIQEALSLLNRYFEVMEFTNGIIRQSRQTVAQSAATRLRPTT